MKALVVYDSVYGNTKKVAEQFAKEFGVKAQKVDEVHLKGDERFEVVVIGSPTHGGRRTEAVAQFIDALPLEVIEQARVICFDTRMDSTKQSMGLRLLMKVIGYAAEKMAKQVYRKCGVVAEVQAFYVEGKEGPLR